MFFFFNLNFYLFYFLIHFQRSYWLTSYTLGILQSHTLHPRALFVSVITKCNLPYEYIKNSLWGWYESILVLLIFLTYVKKKWRRLDKCYLSLNIIINYWRNVIEKNSISRTRLKKWKVNSHIKKNDEIVCYQANEIFCWNLKI
jgi:hypothetical protein